jgi:UDP-3-O-[3-hydroxymyristoyl] glucosamine N-acyltransferase
MSDDTLQKPLMDLKRYEKCKIPHATKVAVNVAVYDGVAVGVDVITKPKSAKINGCVDGVVRAMTWDKVPSLNTVKINF